MKMQINILFVLIACLMACFVSGCGIDLRKGGGSVFSAYLGVDLLKSPASIKTGIGKNSEIVASHEPPDFSDAEKYKYENSQHAYANQFPLTPVSDTVTSNASYYASLKQESDRLFYGSRDK